MSVTRTIANTGLAALAIALSGCLSTFELGLPEAPDANYLVLVRDVLGEAPSASGYALDQPIEGALAQETDLAAFYYTVVPSVLEGATGPLPQVAQGGRPLPYTERIFVRAEGVDAFSAAPSEEHDALLGRFRMPFFDYRLCVDGGGCASTEQFDECERNCEGLVQSVRAMAPQVDCPEDWIRVDLPVGRTCAPDWPPRIECPQGARQAFLAPGCAPLGDCERAWPDAPASGEVAYVQPGATGSGRSAASPMGTIAEALADPRGVNTILLSAGPHPASLPSGRAIELRGVCAGQTTVTGADGPIAVDGAAVSIRDARLDSSEGAVVRARNSAEVSLLRVEVLPGATKALDVRGATLRMESSLIGRRGGGAVDLRNQARLTLEDVTIRGAWGECVQEAQVNLHNVAILGPTEEGQIAIRANGCESLEASGLLIEDTTVTAIQLNVDTATLTDVAIVRSGRDGVRMLMDGGSVTIRRALIDRPAQEAITVDRPAFVNLEAIFVNEPLEQALDIAAEDRIEVHLTNAIIRGSRTQSSIRAGRIFSSSGPTFRMSDVVVTGTMGERSEELSAEVKIGSGNAELNRVVIRDTFQPGLLLSAPTVGSELFIRRVVGPAIAFTGTPVPRTLRNVELGATDAAAVQVASGKSEPSSRIENLHINSSGVGIQVMEGGALELQGAWVEGTQIGVLIEGESELKVSDSRLVQNVFGIVHPARYDLAPLLDNVRMNNDTNLSTP